MFSIRTLVVSTTLAIFLSAITGAALADPGKGNPAAPGQQKKADVTPPPAPPQAQAQTTKATGKAKAKAKVASSQQSGNSSATTAGMKPANNTAKRTHCSTGGTSAAATCTSTGSNTAQAQAKADASKRYGNGKTAAQIAVSRGAPAGTDIYGPGNSQPHKVTDCKHKHGVDVHAVKSYSSAGCAPVTKPETKPEQAQPACPVTTLTTVVTGIWHHTGSKKNPVVLIHPSSNSAHLSKHSDDTLATETVTSTAAGQSCATQSNTTTSTPSATQQQSTASGSVAASGSTEAGQAGVLAAQASKSAASNSGKLASAASAKTTKPSRSGGVLGASGRAAHALGAVATRGRLPFTGFPVWAVLLIGLGLAATGLTLRRRGRVIA